MTIHSAIRLLKVPLFTHPGSQADIEWARPVGRSSLPVTVCRLDMRPKVLLLDRHKFFVNELSGSCHIL